MKISGIYQIQSKLKPERKYIGSAVNIQGRWDVHLSVLKRNKHHSGKLQNHFNKYGETDLHFSILLGCLKEDLLKTEQYFLDSYNPWFNICKIAGSQLGLKRTEDSKQKMSNKAMGHKRNLGRKHSETAKTKMRKPKSEETKKKMSIAKKGKPRINFSEETRKKMSNIRMGVKRGNYNKKV